MSEKKKGATFAEKMRDFRLKVKYLPKKTKKKILVWSLSSVAIAAVVVMGGVSIYNLLMDTVLKPNDIYYKDSYTVSDEKAIAMKDTVVATAGDGELTNGLLKMFYWKRVTNFVSTYGDYLAMVGLDPTLPLDEQVAISSDNFTWQQYFIEGAISDWQRYLALYKAGVEADIGLPDDLKEEFSNLYDKLTKTAQDNGYESVEVLIEDRIGVGVSYDDYRHYFEMYYLGLAYYNTRVEALEVSMDEIVAYFAENAKVVETNYSVTKDSGLAGTVRHILLKPVDEDKDGKYSNEEWKECLAQAEETLEEWKNSSGKEEDFANLAKKLSEDPGSKDNGGLYEGVYKGYGFVESFENWATDKNRQAGDTGIIQSSHGYHIMYYVSGEDAWITCSRELVHEEKVSQMLEEIMTPYVVTVNFKNVALDELILIADSENE